MVCRVPRARWVCRAFLVREVRWVPQAQWVPWVPPVRWERKAPLALRALPV